MENNPSEWLRSLPWTHIALGLSAGLNLALLIVLPFRRAINGIIVNVYRRWGERQDERQQILRELYAKMDTVSHDYLFALVAAEMAQGAAAGPEGHGVFEPPAAPTPK